MGLYWICMAFLMTGRFMLDEKHNKLTLVSLAVSCYYISRYIARDITICACYLHTIVLAGA